MKNIVPRIDKVEGIMDIPAEHETYHVVLRDGRRVSDQNHVTQDTADKEKKYWENILRQWPDGTTMSVYTCKNKRYNK